MQSGTAKAGACNPPRGQQPEKSQSCMAVPVCGGCGRVASGRSGGHKGLMVVVLTGAERPAHKHAPPHKQIGHAIHPSHRLRQTGWDWIGLDGTGLGGMGWDWMGRNWIGQKGSWCDTDDDNCCFFRTVTMRKDLWAVRPASHWQHVCRCVALGRTGAECRVRRPVIWSWCIDMYPARGRGGGWDPPFEEVASIELISASSCVAVS